MKMKIKKIIIFIILAFSSISSFSAEIRSDELRKIQRELEGINVEMMTFTCGTNLSNCMEETLSIYHPRYSYEEVTASLHKKILRSDSVSFFNQQAKSLGITTRILSQIGTAKGIEAGYLNGSAYTLDPFTLYTYSISLEAVVLLDRRTSEVIVITK